MLTGCPVCCFAGYAAAAWASTAPTIRRNARTSSSAGNTPKVPPWLLLCIRPNRRTYRAPVFGESLRNNHLEYEHIPKTENDISEEEIAIKEALERITVKERRIREAYENEIDTLEEYKQNKLRLNAERKELENALDQLRQKAQQTEAAPPDQAEMMAKVSCVYQVLSDPTADNETKATLCGLSAKR